MNVIFNERNYPYMIHSDSLVYPKIGTVENNVIETVSKTSESIHKNLYDAGKKINSDPGSAIHLCNSALEWYLRTLIDIPSKTIGQMLKNKTFEKVVNNIDNPTLKEIVLKSIEIIDKINGTRSNTENSGHGPGKYKADSSDALYVYILSAQLINFLENKLTKEKPKN